MRTYYSPHCESGEDIFCAVVPIKKASPEIGLALGLFLVFALSVFREVYGNCDSKKDDRTAKADYPSKGKGFVLVFEGDRMDAFSQFNADHCVADMLNSYFITIYIGMPISVLRNGGIEQPIAVALYGAFHMGILECC